MRQQLPHARPPRVAADRFARALQPCRTNRSIFRGDRRPRRRQDHPHRGLRGKDFAASGAKPDAPSSRTRSVIGGPRPAPGRIRHCWPNSCSSWRCSSYRNALGEPGPYSSTAACPNSLGYFRLMGLPLPAHLQGRGREIPIQPHVSSPRPGRDIHPGQRKSRRAQADCQAERTQAAVQRLHWDTRLCRFRKPRCRCVILQHPALSRNDTMY